MADILDVQNVLAGLVANAVYPNGTSMPSVGNCPIRIYPGWPLPGSLDADLAAGIVNVSIFPRTATPTTRFDVDWQTLDINEATLDLAINPSLSSITVTGTVATPQTVMTHYNGIGYAYAVQANDTLNSIATGISIVVPGASSTGNVVTVIGAHSLQCNISTAGTSLQEVGREDRWLCITVWASTPALRSTIGSAIISALALTFRISLPDGSTGQVKFKNSQEYDLGEKTRYYKRDINFIVEYAFTNVATYYTITDNIVNIT